MVQDRRFAFYVSVSKVFDGKKRVLIPLAGKAISEGVYYRKVLQLPRSTNVVASAREMGTLGGGEKSGS